MAVALIVAAGSGERLGADRPKAFVMVAGRPMVEWSVAAMRASQRVSEVVVALPPGESAPEGTRGVEGGAARSQSVRAAFEAATPEDLVLVHDAARPLVTPEIVDDLLIELYRSRATAGVIAAAPVPDTVKRVAGGEVVETLDRSELWAVQTPQAFRREALERALDVEDGLLAEATDDAWLVERSGGTVRVLAAAAGAPNFKVTTAEDLHRAELILRDR